jgi:hypothetical protein
MNDICASAWRKAVFPRSNSQFLFGHKRFFEELLIPRPILLRLSRVGARIVQLMARCSERRFRFRHLFLLPGDVQFDLLRPLLRLVMQPIHLGFRLLQLNLQLPAVQRRKHFLAGDRFSFLLGQRVELGGHFGADGDDGGFNAGVLGGDIPGGPPPPHPKAANHSHKSRQSGEGLPGLKVHCQYRRPETSRRMACLDFRG